MIVCFQSLTQVFAQKSSAKMTNTGLTMGGNHIPGLAFAEALRLAGWAGVCIGAVGRVRLHASANHCPTARVGNCSTRPFGLSPTYPEQSRSYPDLFHADVIDLF